MGSLMAGWDSHALDERKDIVRARRNISLTKEEIDAFWKLHKKSEVEETEQFELEEEGDSPNYESPKKVRDITLIKSASLGAQSEPNSPLAHKEVPQDQLRKAYETGDWWTRSNLAFLNDPPHDEMTDSAHKYMAQFDVARSI